MARRAKLWLMLGLMMGLVVLGCSDNADEGGTQEVKAPTAVEKMAGRMPDNVLAFAGTSGGDNVQEAFEQSMLGKIWHDPGVQEFYQAIKQELLGKAQQQIGSEEWGIFNDVKAAAEMVLKRPIIAGVARKTSVAANSPIPPIYGFVFLDAGGQKEQIAALAKKLEAYADAGDIVDVQIGSLTMHGPKDADDVPGYWGWVDNYYVFAVNDGEGLAIKYLTGQVERENSPALNALNKVESNGDLVAFHGDLEKIRQLLEQTIVQHDPEAPVMIQKILSSLGLNEVKSITCRSGFAGPDMVCNGLLEMPQPFTGLPACLKPIDVVSLEMVDSRAFNVCAFNCDLAGVFDTIIGTIEGVEPRDVAEFKREMAEMEAQTGIKIRDGLLASLAGPAVVYALPMGMSMDVPNGGFVIILDLKDAALMEKTLNTIGALATAESEGMVQVNTTEQDGVKINVCTIAPIAMAGITPCWTIKDDKLIISTVPAIQREVIAHIASKDRAEKSICFVDGFKQAADQLPENTFSFGYTDTKLQCKQIMVLANRFWPMATMFAQKADINLPAMLPELDSLIEQMGPSCQYSWYDADGIHIRSRGPISSVSMAGVAGAGVGAAVLMPALGRARGQAKNVVSLSQLKQIVLGCMMYGEDNQGKLPDDLKSLIPTYLPDGKILESPLKPNGFDGPSYIYVSGLTMEMPEPHKTIIVYENPDYSRGFVNAAFLDGHCEKMHIHQFQEALKRNQKQPDQ